MPPTITKKDVNIHILAIKNLSRNRKQIKIAEGNVGLLQVNIPGRGEHRVIKCLNRGRYIVEPL